MTGQRKICPPAIVATLAVAFVLLAASCGGSTSSAQPATPSAAPSPMHATPAPAPSPPPGGPLPTQLLGDWFLPPATTVAVDGANACPSPPTVQTCFLKLNLTETDYHLTLTQTPTGSGNIVVNNDEIDFFNGGNCGLYLPDGVGRYKWTLTGGSLRLKSLDQDPCPRDGVLNQTWSRTP
jgi:hypothetical protein